MVQTDLIDQGRQFVTWASSSPFNLAITVVGIVLVAHLIPFFLAPHLWFIPGPVGAHLSDLWLVRQAQKGKRFLIVHDLHSRYGKFVRLAPNHISIADPDAIETVYGHGKGTLKSEFYDAFVPPKPAVRGLFNTRDRAEHTRKRKIVSHTFAPKSIVAFEPFIRREIQLLVDRWDEFCAKADKENVQGPRNLNGRAWLDALMWLNFFAFDTIGDLAFGKPFGMLEQGADDARVEFEDAFGKKNTTTCNAVQIINERGEYSATLGCAPTWMRPYLAKLPWFSTRLASVKKLTGIATSRVNERLEHGSDREDLLAKLQNAKDDQGEQMGKMELVCEALTQLIAGSDTTSNTSCAIIYHLCTNPKAMQKLQAELDDALKDSEDVPSHDEVQELPYLNAVLSESLRFHSTSAMGLPRIVPVGGATIQGKYFPAGSVVSVPSYTIHRDKGVYGSDAESYNPDRWLINGARQKYEKAFVPFSVGPRACVGRNVAMQELSILIATLIHRYDIVLKYPDQPLDTIEGFLRKPTVCEVGITRRH
ncbi:hypothetical protein L7F22_039430 [Adiantum nelumboides]|nr:hypothetical protein [Adiantum nelumboides]